MSSTRSGYVKEPAIKMYYSAYVKSLNASAIVDASLIEVKTNMLTANPELLVDIVFQASDTSLKRKKLPILGFDEYPVFFEDDIPKNIEVFAIYWESIKSSVDARLYDIEFYSTVKKERIAMFEGVTIHEAIELAVYTASSKYKIISPIERVNLFTRIIESYSDKIPVFVRNDIPNDDFNNLVSGVNNYTYRESKMFRYQKRKRNLVDALISVLTDAAVPYVSLSMKNEDFITHHPLAKPSFMATIFNGTDLKEKCFIDKNVCAEEVTRNIYKISDQKIVF